MPTGTSNSKGGFVLRNLEMIKQDADERKRSQEGQQSGVNSLSQEVVSMGINEGDKVQPPPALSNGDDSQSPPR